MSSDPNLENKTPSLEKEEISLSLWYAGSLVILAFLAVITTFLPYIISLSQSWQQGLELAGKVILGIFFLDFLFFWYKSQWSWAYVKKNWYNLVIFLTPLQGLKALKGLKAIKALKGVKGLKIFKVFKLGKKLKGKVEEQERLPGC